MNPISDKIEVQDNFEIEKYMGKWYEIARSKNIPLENGNFVYEAYMLEPDGKIKVEASQTIEGKEQKIHQLAFVDKNLPSVWRVKLIDSFFLRMFKFDYKVVETDYTTYSIVYSKNRYMWFFTKEMAWILCRNPHIDKNNLDQLYAKLEEKTGMPKENMRETLQ